MCEYLHQIWKKSFKIKIIKNDFKLNSREKLTKYRFNTIDKTCTYNLIVYFVQSRRQAE